MSTHLKMGEIAHEILLNKNGNRVIFLAILLLILKTSKIAGGWGDNWLIEEAAAYLQSMPNWTLAALSRLYWCMRSFFLAT